MELPLHRILHCRTHCFGEYLNISATKPSYLGKLWYPNVNDIEFVPDFMIVRSVAISQSIAAAAQTNVFGFALMFSDGTGSLQAVAILCGGPAQVCAAGACNIGSITSPHTVITLRKPISQCRFQCYTYTATTSSLGPGTGSGIGGPALTTFKPYVSVIVNFITMVPGIPRGLPRLSLDWVENTFHAFLFGGTGQAVQGDSSTMVAGLSAIRPDYIINHGSAMNNSYNEVASPTVIYVFFILDGKMQVVYANLSLGNNGTNAGTGAAWGYESSNQTIFKIQDPERLRSQVNFKHWMTISVTNADDTLDPGGTQLGDHGSLMGFIQLKDRRP